MECLRLIKKFLGVMFKLEPYDLTTCSVKEADTSSDVKKGDLNPAPKKNDDDGDYDEDEELAMGAVKVLATCVGVGFTNLNKTVS